MHRSQPHPTLTPLPTYTPVAQPTQIPTHTARPTYTPEPTYTTIPSPEVEIIEVNATNNNYSPPTDNTISDNTTSSFTASYIKVTFAKMTQILKSVSGYQSTYHDGDPNDLYSGEGGREKVPVNCHAALNQYQELQRLEIKSADNFSPEQQAAFSFYRQGWDQYMNVIIPVVERCQTAVSNQETLETIGHALYYGATAVFRGSVKDLFNQAIYSLEDN